MLMLGRGQWARQGSMRSDAGVSGVYAPLTKGDRGKGYNLHAARTRDSSTITKQNSAKTAM